jgi:trans-feruloyl-CoA hydratase/vanillin synthase
VATLRFDRAEKRNALSPDLHQDWHDALDEIDANESVKAVVVTGTGESFSAGMDLELCFLEPFDDRDRYARQSRLAQSNFVRLQQLRPVTIAKVNGWAFGGGLEIAGICDIVVTSESAVFGLSEINFGLFPAGGTMWAIAQNVSRKQALYWVLTGRTFTGVEAVSLGLATKAVPADELDAAVAEILVDITNKNIHSLRAAKRAYEWANRLDLEDSNEIELALQWQLSHRSGNAWINEGLSQFRDRQYRPGIEAHKTSQ